MPKGPFKEIKDTGIFVSNKNGGRDQEILFYSEMTQERFRIFVHSESYDFQSYGRLYKWSEKNGWNLIHQVNPKRDYNIDLSYRNDYSQSAYTPIIKELKSIAKHFISHESTINA